MSDLTYVSIDIDEYMATPLPDDVLTESIVDQAWSVKPFGIYVAAGPEQHPLPCPFCGSANLIIDSDDTMTWYVWCLDCEAAGPRCDNKSEAVEYWNRRTR